MQGSAGNVHEVKKAWKREIDKERKGSKFTDHITLIDSAQPLHTALD